jgi:hypothetical protein
MTTGITEADYSFVQVENKFPLYRKTFLTPKCGSNTITDFNFRIPTFVDAEFKIEIVGDFPY